MSEHEHEHPREPLQGPDVPSPVAAHELLFGREFTSGCLLEQGERSDAAVEECAERVTASPAPSSPPEQRKRNSFRV